MDKELLRKFGTAGWLAALILAWPAIGAAQGSSNVPADAGEEIPLLSAAELTELVGPIALYPDDLLAIVLPASTFPLQLVQADRFLQDLKNDSTLTPDEDWDDSVVALTNYPEVVELLTDELDKTWRLGEAVVAQQADVIAAVESFRDRAYAAGNLQSDTHQTVAQNDGVIEITPVQDDVIYVPYYEPERVVVYQSRPAYYYYPRPYPVYYYPYPYGYDFHNSFFWGVTTAFTVGWYTDSLHVYHPSYYGHPYYGRSYRHNYWYRRPDIHVYNNYYYGGHSGNYQYRGDNWRPHSRRTVSVSNHRVTRSRQYPGSTSRPANVSGTQSSRTLQNNSRAVPNSRSEIRFRERDSIKSASSRAAPKSQEYKFRERTTTRPPASPKTNLQKTNLQKTNSSMGGPSRSSQVKLAQNSVSESRYSTPKSSQPSRSTQQTRLSQPARSAQQTRVSQPRATPSTRPSSSGSGVNKSSTSKSSQTKAAGADRGRSDHNARDRRK